MRAKIDEILAQQLVAAQFPQWQGLPIRPIEVSGWDNRVFHLGESMLIRIPSAEQYSMQVAKEQRWLPKLAPLLPLEIPTPLAIGNPSEDYPWSWSIYRWIDGDAVASAKISDLCEFAASLGRFLAAFQRITVINGPEPGLHNFYRGGALTTYDAEVRQAITVLKNKIDAKAAIALWEQALATYWHGAPVWVHGDISPGNLLVKNGRLNAVIDFGQLAVGDPACDLVVAWTLFKGKSREVFKNMLQLDAATWSRGRAWALWKALIVAAGFSNPNNAEAQQCWRIIDDILAEHKG